MILEFEGYEELLDEMIKRIRSAQMRAALALNRELVFLYWSIGRDILARQQHQGWGTKVVEYLSADLRREFPEMKGFSRTNLLYMRLLAVAYSNEEFVQQVVVQIPWGHNVTILDKVKDPALREWYLKAAFEYGWSRNVLAFQIDSNLYERQGKSLTNFEQTLPKPQSDLAQNLLKDPYVFDFLTVGQEAEERSIERDLIAHIRDFLMELGVGFAFVGSQVHLEIDGDDYYLDLLFYHLKLRCFVVIELKATEFKPEHTGKMNFYLSAVDDLFKHENDAPTIGLILCRTKKRVTVEYALRNLQSPVGVSEYQILQALPETLKGDLPTVEEIEEQLRTSSEGD